jgi:ribosomal protein S1
MGLNTEVNKDNKLTEEFKKLLENDFKDRKLEENNIVSAVITEITKNYVVVDLKAKQEGMIPIEEFKNEMDKIKVGQKN